MFQRYWSVVLGAAFALCATAQTTALLTGRVTDATSSLGLANAAVEVSIGDSTLITLSDSLGYFRFAAVPTGIAEVRASLVGYASAAQSDVWLRSGKPEQVELQLQREGKELPQATVRGVSAPLPPRPGTYELTVEKSLRYPATFFDPARLASTYPGVAATNDQANHFSVRGNGPNSNAWLLEGAEIVSPNHLGNAGTPTDNPTLSGGSTILSAQMLGTSRLLTGAMSVQYGNALGGIMDMHLRSGANDRARFTGQVGLIGIDLSTEGPFAKGKRGSYLVNYRYSTLGLLGAMGVELGDEAITFQDLAFHVALPMERASLSVFGMGGVSSNSFRSLEDTAAWAYDKDSQNIDYSGGMGAAGATLRVPMGRRASWSTTVVYSVNEQERSATGIYFRRGFVYSSFASIREQKISATSQLRGSWGARFNYQVGGSAMERWVWTAHSFRDTTEAWLLRPYVLSQYALTEGLSVEAGLGWSLYTFNGSSVPEPRLVFNWRPVPGRSITLAAGQRSQLPQVQNFLVGPFYIFWDNSHLGLTRLQEVVFAYDHAIKPHLALHAEVFYQHLFDIPVLDTTRVSAALAGGFSMVNVWDEHYTSNLAQEGEARNQGIELSLQHHFHRGFHYLVNATWMEANYNDALGRTHPTRWHTTVLCNAILGKEFAKQKDDAKRTWGVNIRVNVMGGQRTTAIDTLLSHSAGFTVYEQGDPYEEQYGMVHRIDIRVYLKREHRNRTGMWALDLLNTTNAQNEAFHYYDNRQRAVVTKYQLGLIPNISYRIEF